MIENEILGPCEPEGYRDYAADIHLASGHLHDLIQSLLDTARIEADQLRVEARDIDLVDLLHEIMKIVKHQADRGGITLTVEPAMEALSINADPVLLRRLMLNLANNAIKFTDAGGRVGISLERDEDGGAILRFADTGQGIAAKDIETALTQYGQVGNSSDGRSGLGLGLPMAKAIALAHGGSLGIDSEVGTGTTVTVRLPVTPPVAAVD